MMGSSNRMAGPHPSLVGRVCMATGATGGLGQVVAAELGGRGATVILVCRREPAANLAVDHVALGHIVHPPQGVQNLLAADHSARLGRQQVQQALLQ
jgi:NAD(P)-dependent dehydrogenase (short-subunit alcohol dehydrogenase family)